MGQEAGREIWRTVCNSNNATILSLPNAKSKQVCLFRFTCQFGGSTWVFLNSSRVVTDLMERRAAIYNSRPPFPMTQGIMSGDSRIVLMPYNEQWRTVRKIMHQILRARALDVFMPF